MRKTIYSTESQVLSNWLINQLINQRERAGLTLRDFAKILRIHHSIIGKIEKGERRIDVIEFIRYCDALGADPHAAIDEIRKAVRGRKKSD